jgi:dTDP-glucose pyrophosphorylase
MSLYAIEALRDAGVIDIAIVLGTIAPKRYRSTTERAKSSA